MMVAAVLFVSGAFAAPKKAKKAAEPPPPQESLRAEALKEAWSQGTPVSAASDAQVSGLITLEDPGLRDTEGPWKWTFDLSAQNYQPRGTAALEAGLNVDLSQNAAGVLPRLRLGRQRLIESMPGFSFGVHGGVGYTTQKTSVVFPSGLTVDDVRVSTGLAEIGADLQWRPARLNSLQLEGSLLTGLVNVSQAGKNDIVNFSQQASWNGVAGAIWYWPKNTWAVGVEQARRELQGQHDIQLDADATSAQMRFIW